jgi:hypothetical protein
LAGRAHLIEGVEEASTMLETTERHVGAMRSVVRSASGHRSIGRFLLHYFEMCAPMCIGFALGDLVYFWAAGRAGYSEPFSELPELSVAIVTFSMTAPMAALMLVRHMPRRVVAEMAAVMPILALLLIGLGWLAVLPMGDLVLVEHGAMMPAMLVPMFLRLDLYTEGHAAHG